MLLNEDVMKSANVGTRKGYFATFFIPPAEEDECVFQDIVKTEKEWRPDTSLSRHTSTSSSRSNRGSKSPRARSGRGKGPRGRDVAKGLDHELDDVDPERDRDRASTARSSKAMSILSSGGYSESTPPPPPSRLAMRNHPTSGRRFVGRGQPIKYAFDQGKAFATPRDRTKMTSEVIQEAHRGSGGDSKERTCRPYSSYTVYHKRENIAISPYGEPNLKGAAGRYREQYQSLTNSEPTPNDVTQESRDYVFKKFFENLTARASLNHRSPIGALKKPPPKPIRKPRERTDSMITQLHKQAKSRMTSVQKDLGNDQDSNREGWHHGVEYVIAMEMSHNLEKHRMKRSYSFPSLPTVAVAAATTTRLDAPRLRTQSVNYLTPGETSIRGGIETNVFDEERTKRGPLTCIQRKPRVRSPPLSKLSRDRFLPQAMRRREMERQENIAGLRVAGANTPVTDWKTESERRPKSTMTATTKMQLESLASKSIGEICDSDAENLDNIDDDLEAENANDCAVEELCDNHETGDQEPETHSDRNQHDEEDTKPGEINEPNEDISAGGDKTVAEETDGGCESLTLNIESEVNGSGISNTGEAGISNDADKEDTSSVAESSAHDQLVNDVTPKTDHVSEENEGGDQVVDAVADQGGNVAEQEHAEGE